MASGGAEGPPGPGRPGDELPEEGAGPSRPAVDPARLSADLETPEPIGEATAGSGTRPEGNTQRQAPDRRAGVSAVSQDPLVGRVVLGRYRIDRRIGSGGMGSVYAGVQLAVGREVALKVLRQDLMAHEHIRQRFRREAEVIGRLDHPNTIRLFDYGETEDGLALMVTELLRGSALNERLKQEGPMSVEEVLDLGEGVARSLAEAHAAGLVHRDLKPANIFLVQVGSTVVPKVLDFGIARIMDEEATRITSTGQVFGTPRYMSPEQAISTADVDARADLYSLGLILYEGLVGQPPFVAQTSYQYLSAHASQSPPKLRERFPAAPADLEALIDQCLQKEPDARPSSATELADALARLRRRLEGLGTEPSLPPAPPEPEPDIGSNRGGLAVVVLLAAVLGGFFAYAAGVLPEVPGWGGAVGAGPGDVGPARAFDGSGLAVLLPPTSESALDDAEQDDEDPDVLEPGEESPGPAEPDGALEPDGGVGSRPPAPEPRARRTPRRRPSRPAEDQAGPDAGQLNKQLGKGAIAGPRGLEIPPEEGEDETDVVRLSKSCRDSVWRGLGRFETSECPSDCAIMMDETCAGRTPAVDRPMGPGLRNFVVICRDRVVVERRVRVEARKTAVLSCR